MRRTYKGKIELLESNEIFVFGSNTEGRHGLGAAKIARERFGAKYGQAEGLQGNSYAIITKDLTKNRYKPSRTKEEIIEQIKKLYKFANEHKDYWFLIAYTDSGKNLNNYSSEEMACMFNCDNIPENIVFEESFNKLLNKPLVEKVNSLKIIE